MGFVFRGAGRLISRASTHPFRRGRRCKSYYITTPIFYVNSVPHIGHLYTATLADAAQRWERLKRGELGEDCDASSGVVFATGTDEHGQKIHQAALKAKTDPIKFCDKVSERFKDIYRTCDIGYTDFIRTTEQRHNAAVKAFWQLLEKRGYIYKGSYEGWYSVQDETFLPETQTTVVYDKVVGAEVRVSQESGHRVEWMTEDNYIFKLSSVIGEVKAWVGGNPNCIYPAVFHDEVLRMLDTVNSDISVSRERSRVSWGIDTPSDPTQSVYVWLDALVNYLAVAGFPDVEGEKFGNTWPADCHLIGRDILKFHAVYWPAFLIAAGLDLPKQIVVHRHWLKNGRKMSKSLGNVVDPFALAGSVTGEGLKYFLLRQGVIEHDCDYSNELLLQAVDGDLCNTLGNCLNRAVAPKLNPEQIYPEFHEESYLLLDQKREDGEENDIMKMVQELPDQVEHHCKEFHFFKAVNAIFSCVREANFLIHSNKIWHLDRMKENEKKLADTAMHCVYETLRVSGILLLAFVPNLANRLLDRLNVFPHERTLHEAKSSFLKHGNQMSGRTLGKDKGILVQKVKNLPGKT